MPIFVMFGRERYCESDQPNREWAGISIYVCPRVPNTSEVVPEDSRAFAVNNSGQVVGIAAQCAFLWDPIAGIQRLPTLKGFNGGAARGINAAGHVVGCARVNPACRVTRFCIVMDL